MIIGKYGGASAARNASLWMSSNGSANQDSEFQVRNLKSFHRGRPTICWLLPATPKVVPVDSLAERTELTPSRLFSSARRNCSRDGSYRQLPADGLQITPQCRSQPRWSRPLSPTTFVIVANQKCQLYRICINIFTEIIIAMAWVCGFLM